MTKTIEKVSVTATGLSEHEREMLERELTGVARAMLDEDTVRDAETLTGIAEFEAGDFITIEEWKGELGKLKADLRQRRGS